MMHALTRSAALAATALALALATPATAQQPAPPAPAGERMEITKDKLAAYVSARQQMREINQQWAERIRDSATVEEATEMRQSAQNEMIAAVRDEGLRVAEFNAILDLEQRDPAIRATIAEMEE